MDVIHCPDFLLKLNTRRFGDWICLRPQVKGIKRKPPILLGPLERANLNHWTNGQIQIQFPKRRVFSFNKKSGRWIKSRNLF
jgi:hypothetical protein